MPSIFPLADIVVANIHGRFTGVSATVRSLTPYLRATRQVDLLDTGRLGLGGEITVLTLLRWGWTKPSRGQFRLWHARRDVEILLGVFLRSVLRQPWRVVFTSAAPRRHGRVLQWMINRSDAIVATSARAASFLDWHTMVIHHGVDTNWFCPPIDSRESLLRRLVSEQQVPGERGGELFGHSLISEKTRPLIAIGQFGRIRFSKGTDLFVWAMIQLLPKYEGFIAVISGLCQKEDEGYLSDLRKSIEAAGLAKRILFLGDLTPERIREWYQAVSVVVAASRSEGFGLTPLEAMASGCPVVASHAGIWPEVVDSEVGALFETGSREDLVDKLEPLLEDPERILNQGQCARARAVKRHSVTFEAQQLLKVYDAFQQ